MSANAIASSISLRHFASLRSSGLSEYTKGRAEDVPFDGEEVFNTKNDQANDYGQKDEIWATMHPLYRPGLIGISLIHHPMPDLSPLSDNHANHHNQQDFPAPPGTPDISCLPVKKLLCDAKQLFDSSLLLPFLPVSLHQHLSIYDPLCNFNHLAKRQQICWDSLALAIICYMIEFAHLPTTGIFHCILPSWGAIQGPEEFIEGMALGLKALVGGAVGGLAGAASRITGAMAKGVAAITMDEDYQQKRREAMNKQPSGFKEGITRGGKGLVSGFVSGITGIITKPIRGAQKEGAAGFFKGVGKGLVGAVARPTGGIIDMASSTFQGIKRQECIDCQ
ncbi:hypothetical protein JD844_009145 [Phrynosoma platyrhinos]|uniref:Uncharacterized protein n=1 Tax=Phrynosoma platyrhinos TaxID=52577 RepID=A0ABQ7TFQ0_PHRPL|nr:hypothetical protein JD844_009145 [Phrynosoma platyrhinos]